MLYTNTIERGTLELLKSISSNPVFLNFYLAGGTALALQVGHRKSIDLDFFCTTAFDVTAISHVLEHEYHALLINQYPNTILTEISGVKVDYFTPV
ncbi:nucleotidyl transferase AbiEii/AbiGii toxin family protein [Reichenbachiella sp. MALMAid0571]|uniref:nucleotidyl transferase AbiEii/AbiGii toxin family protein n=1 Tax=Reichenbachiella sp. MALMAid0571 TaxID=3143939 RepID=UPI0032DEE118